VNLPDGLRDPNGLLFDDGITNLERFAFGLSLTQPTYDFQPLKPADPPTETIDGKQYVVYTYDVNEAAVVSGLNIVPQVSHDQQTWTDVVNIIDPLAAQRQFVSRQGNRITLKHRRPRAAVLPGSYFRHLRRDSTLSEPPPWRHDEASPRSILRRRITSPRGCRSGRWTLLRPPTVRDCTSRPRRCCRGTAGPRSDSRCCRS
jgi:hypothetical protein